LILESLAVGPLQTNCFVVACEETRKGIVVDPGDNVQAILDAIGRNEVELVEIVATHGHFDHIGRAATLVERTGVPFAAHRGDLHIIGALQSVAGSFGLSADPPPHVSRYLEEGDTVEFGNTSVRVLHTPGHSPGGIALVWPGNAIVGDTVFAGSIGRTDFEGGDLDILLESVRTRLFPLGDGVRLHPGHGGSTTVAQERQTNPFLAGI